MSDKPRISGILARITHREGGGNGLARTPEAAVRLRIGNIHAIGERENQQDSFGVSNVSNARLCGEKGVLAVIADGMGGLSSGSETSAAVTAYMLSSFSATPAGMDPCAELLSGVMGANREIAGRPGFTPGKSGSTVAAVIVKGASLHFVSVGDSRIYLYRAGELVQVNREHTYASELYEKAARCEITLEEAESDPMKDALTSFVGMEKLTLVDRTLRPVALIPGDRILLMTDGVFRTLCDEEIRCAASLGAYKAAAKLESLVASKKKAAQDNYTAIVMECL